VIASGVIERRRLPLRFINKQHSSTPLLIRTPRLSPIVKPAKKNKPSSFFNFDKKSRVKQYQQPAIYFFFLFFPAHAAKIAGELANPPYPIL